jgi:hypothetical protein
MILVDKGLMHLVAGYDRISQADTVIRRRWRQPLLLAYSRRREIYEADLTIYRNRSTDFRKRFRIGIWLSSVLLIIGAVAFPALILLGQLGSLRGPILCFAPILVLAGLNGWALLGMLWMWQKERIKPPPPQNPLENRISAELLVEWRQGLSGTVLGQKGDRDAPGVYHLIARLLPTSDDSFLIDCLNVDENEQVDVVLIGSKGIWLFEAIHLNGVICWNDGIWTRSRGIHSLQKDDLIELARDEQAFETVWTRKAVRISTILEQSLPDVFAMNPRVARVRGGLVFTHPQARFVIPAGVSFNWGITKFWLEKLREVPAVTGADERISLRIVEALLCNHQENAGLSRTKSMLSLADELIRQAEGQLKTWIAEV